MSDLWTLEDPRIVPWRNFGAWRPGATMMPAFERSLCGFRNNHRRARRPSDSARRPRRDRAQHDAPRVRRRPRGGGLRAHVPGRRAARHRLRDPGLHVRPEQGRGLPRRRCSTHGHEDHIGALPYLLRDRERARVRHAADPGARWPRSCASTACWRAPICGRCGRARRSTWGPSASSRSGSPTRSWTASAWRSTRPSAPSSSPATSSSTRVRSTASRPTIGASPSSASGACSCSARTRPTWTAPATRARRSTSARRWPSGSPRAPGRIILATFASHIHRIQQVLTLAERFGRRVALLGRSMEKNVTIAAELGYLRVPAGLVQPLEDVVELPAAPAGDPLHRQPGRAELRADPDGGGRAQVRADRARATWSSSPSRVIPGHERTVGRVINALYRRGAEVLYEDNAFVHVSGHASQEDLKLMLSLTRPRYFVPVHGEYRHLLGHARLAESVGIARGADLPHRGRRRVEVGKSRRARLERLPGRPRAGRWQGHRRRRRRRAARSRDPVRGRGDRRLADRRRQGRRGDRTGDRLARGVLRQGERDPRSRRCATAVLAALAERGPDDPWDREAIERSRAHRRPPVRQPALPAQAVRTAR